MRDDASRVSQSASSFGRYLAVILASLALTGCNVKEDPTGVVAITVSPGQTGNCESSPCAVSLVMPPGSGSYEVTGNEATIGTYPAGQTVQIGSFYQSQAFEVRGASVPKAYVYIPATP